MHGDRNTSYFQIFALERKKFNTIKGLIIAHGNWCFDDDSISDIILDFYLKLFDTYVPLEQFLNEVFVFVEPFVTEYMNSKLCALIS